METKISPKTGAVLSTLLSSLMLGTSYVAVKISVEGANPFLLGAAVMLVGCLVVLPIMVIRGTLNLAMFKRWELWAGSLANTWVVSTTYAGLTMINASAAGLIIGTNVAFVALFSWITFGERLSRKRGLGLALALGGLVTLTTHWDLSVLEGSTMIGNALLLLAAAGIGVAVILSRVALRSLQPDQWAFGMHMMLPLTLALLFFLVPMDGGISAADLPGIVFIGAVCTTVPTILWTGALKHISVVTSATVLLVESAFAVFLSWLLLGESLDAFAAVGAVMIFIAIALLARTD